jgi:hypothetical protein
LAQIVILPPQPGVLDFQLFGAALRAAAPKGGRGRRREALPSGTEPLGMNAQFRGHFRGRFAAVEPELNRVLFEGLVKPLPSLLGFNHWCIHTGIIFRCLSLPVSVFSRRPSDACCESVKNFGRLYVS